MIPAPRFEEFATVIVPLGVVPTGPVVEPFTAKVGTNVVTVYWPIGVPV